MNNNFFEEKKDHGPIFHNPVSSECDAAMYQAIARDPDLSWGAKGLLMLIISLPENESIYSSQIFSMYKGEKTGGRKGAMMKLIKELVEQGYLTLVKKYKPKGGLFTGHMYEFCPKKLDEEPLQEGQ